MRKPFLPAAFAFLLAATSGPTVAAEKWQRYTNARFGTIAEYPADLFEPEEQPENGDGLAFTSRDGTAEIRVYGSHAPSTVTDGFPRYRNWLTKQEVDEGLKVSYRAGGKDWFAVSGEARGRIVYIRVVGDCPGLSFAHHVRIEYPFSDKALYDPVVSRVAKSLKSGGCRDDQK